MIHNSYSTTVILCGSWGVEHGPTVDAKCDEGEQFYSYVDSWKLLKPVIIWPRITSFVLCVEDLSVRKLFVG